MSDKIVLDPEGKIAANCNVYEKAADECRTTIEIAKGFTTDKIPDNCEVTGEVPNPPEPSTHDAVLRYSYTENPNYMKQVADMLDVELNEQFMIRNQYGIILDERYIIDHQGAWEVDGVIKQPVSDVLINLLNSKWVLVKLPWNPRHGDTVYSIDLEGSIVPLVFDEDCRWHVLGLYHDLIFKTREEAKENVKRCKEFWNNIKKEINDR